MASTIEWEILTVVDGEIEDSDAYPTLKQALDSCCVNDGERHRLLTGDDTAPFWLRVVKWTRDERVEAYPTAAGLPETYDDRSKIGAPVRRVFEVMAERCAKWPHNKAIA